MLIANGQLSLAEFEALAGKHFGHCKALMHEVNTGALYMHGVFGCKLCLSAL